MNDAEILEWLAEHLWRFRIDSNIADMLYHINSGNIQEARFQTDKKLSRVEMLRACVTIAVNRETENKKPKQKYDKRRIPQPNT